MRRLPVEGDGVGWHQRDSRRSGVQHLVVVVLVALLVDLPVSGILPGAAMNDPPRR